MKNLPIIKHTKMFFAISLAFILIGLGFAAVQGFSMGIDFTGGTLMEIKLGSYVETTEIRQITDEFDSSASISYLGTAKDTIQIRTMKSLSNKERNEVFDKFKEKYKLDNAAFLKSEQFGPAVGNEIKRNALISLAVAIAAMLVYITFRFQISYGIAAVIALAHNVLAVLAVYALFRIPLNGPFIAAILTVVGYSVNDTIVIFDRIRENMKNIRKSSIEEVADRSITQTIGRSINTSVTTLLAIIALFIFGTTSIREFTLPLIAGISIGTYSSICIASPIWVLLNKKVKKLALK